ncbi:hypothetical protein D6789_01680 [Candidatus Woesearchaeota archaeon]|nr:MAG: hypothetical protein D6789_01680 [Candidatus Woesearchaeota archaeon]
MVTDVKKLLGSEKLVIGTDRVLKAVRAGTASTVILASNAPAELREELSHLQRIGGFTIEDAGVPNDELGTRCKKQFSIAALAVLK